MEKVSHQQVSPSSGSFLWQGACGMSCHYWIHSEYLLIWDDLAVLILSWLWLFLIFDGQLSNNDGRNNKGASVQ